MYVTFQRYELKRPNDCDSNFIAVYEGALSDERRLAQFCGTATEPQKSEGNLVYVRYYARPDALGGKFEIVYTAFREAGELHRHTPWLCGREYGSFFYGDSTASHMRTP